MREKHPSGIKETAASNDTSIKTTHILPCRFLPIWLKMSSWKMKIPVPGSAVFMVSGERTETSKGRMWVFL